MFPKYTDRMANCVDPNQTAVLEQSDLGLHYLLRPFVPIYKAILEFYGNYCLIYWDALISDCV